jgi:DnaJ C terminal domain
VPAEIRTSRVFSYDFQAGRWEHVHHHGSIDDPAALRAYQEAGRATSHTQAEDPRFRHEGHDLVTSLDVAAPAAALGATLEVPTPDGTASIDLPPGSQPGDVLTLSGKGVRQGRRTTNQSSTRTRTTSIKSRRVRRVSIREPAPTAL